MNIQEKLSAIQTALKAPKGQYNKFGNYNYRNCEDILEALKPLLKTHHCTVTLSDEVVPVGNRIYIKATATLSDGSQSVQTTAFAREADSKKGMDEAQITGSASSYARKYALNGLFAIDDTKDADNFDNRQSTPTICPDAFFDYGLSVIKKGVDKEGRPFGRQQFFEVLQAKGYILSQEQQTTLGEMYEQH